jgi:ABC-type transporter MlaC component
MFKKGRAEVQSNIVLSDGRKVPIYYRLTNKSGQWKVYDLIIEGAILVKKNIGPSSKIFYPKNLRKSFWKY